MTQRDTTGDAPSFEVGDSVQLKTGGTAMTAGELDQKKGRRCAWSVKDGIKEKFFPEKMLQPYQEPRDVRVRVELVPPDHFQLKFKTALETIAAGIDDPRALATAVLHEAEVDPGEELR